VHGTSLCKDDLVRSTRSPPKPGLVGRKTAHYRLGDVVDVEISEGWTVLAHQIDLIRRRNRGRPQTAKARSSAGERSGACHRED